jgi:TPR repeat protein
MYRDGIGTSVNFDEAMRWLKAGAIQDDYNAQLGLAQMYEVGIGTQPDARLAQMWKQRADNNPVIVRQRQQAAQQAQQQQAAQQMMFLGLAAVVEAMTRPDVYVVY